MGKLPALNIYPGDWYRRSISGCSLEAQGLWLRLLLLLHTSERRGYLQFNGRPPSLAQIARMTGCHIQDLLRLLKELEESAVFCRSKSGHIYSKEMVSEEADKKTFQRLARRQLVSINPEKASWNSIRKLILGRDVNLCGYCGDNANTVDHIIPRIRGGSNSPKNLIAACQKCNCSKNGRTPKEAGIKIIKGGC